MNKNITKNKFLIFVSFLTILLVGGCADYKEARHAKKNGDYETALAHFEELADFGHAPSQLELARMYLKGQGVEKNPEKAAALLQKAVISNNEKAYFELGRLYERGRGVPKDVKLAEENYNKSIEYGYARAATYLAKLIKRNGEELE